MEQETVSPTWMADPEKAAAAAPYWWAYAGDFPHWYVWRGVAGHYYARIPGISPQRVVRALSAEGLREEIQRTELARRSIPFSSRLWNHCA